MEAYMWVVWYVAGAFAGIYSLWAFFLAVMALQRAYDAKTLSKVALVLGLPIIVTGFFDRLHRQHRCGIGAVP